MEDHDSKIWQVSGNMDQIKKHGLEKVLTNGCDVIEEFAAKNGKPFDKGAFLAAVYAEDQLRVRFAALS